jgi:hypothetical protein
MRGVQKAAEPPRERPPCPRASARHPPYRALLKENPAVN